MNLISLMGLDIPGPLRNVRNERPREPPVESQRCVEKPGDEAADQMLLVGDQTEQRAPLGTGCEKAPCVSGLLIWGTFFSILQHHRRLRLWVSSKLQCQQV